ncbi:hypothetical protein J4526_06850 [Desulfurococcaceae archaeon MEX13E-LK6-19]|nr:hypothetical protein J4526_06850 [Desulfurococcaceae archaeon MEX13E-LK6-19]
MTEVLDVVQGVLMAAALVSLIAGYVLYAKKKKEYTVTLILFSATLFLVTTAIASYRIGSIEYLVYLAIALYAGYSCIQRLVYTKGIGDKNIIRRLLSLPHIPLALLLLIVVLGMVTWFIEGSLVGLTISVLVGILVVIVLARSR